ncbi:MAG: peptidase [Alphaproteobacteria bacterium]|nr:peptidase [Alphaproteobacteria bacterium]
MSLGRLRAGLALLLALSAPAATQSRAPVAMSVTLAPRPAAASPGEIGAVEIVLRFEPLEIAAGEPLLRLPLVSSNVDTAATVLAKLSARDSQGPLDLSAHDIVAPDQAARDAVIGGPSRDWVADRAVVGPVTVRYTLPADAALPPRGAAPPFAFSSDGGGVSAAGHVFLLLPPSVSAYRLTVDWDLAALPSGARGVSSLGEGRVTSGEMSAGQVRSTFYMAGRIHTFPARVPATGFFAAWQGEPPFGAPALMAWTGRLYERYCAFFSQGKPPPYGVFLRYNPINAGGGVGLHHSFVTTFGKGDGSDSDKVRITLAHEMFHTFQPFIEQPAGLESSWFGEGLATFYQTALPLRFGMIGPDLFLAGVNSTAARYYSSLMANVPNSQVPVKFWADTRIRTLPYDRGMLYFATVDDSMRKASNGRKSLDDLVLAMLALQHQGRVTSNADWESLLRRELGAGAVDEFRAVLGGRMPVPASDAFGPCFRRTSAPMRRYELGFEPAVLAEPKRVVRGLVAGSAAERAGLRNGDEIVVPVPQDGLQGDQKRLLTLQVRRAGATFAITYLPRGETVSTYQWQRVPAIADSACARRAGDRI